MKKTLILFILFINVVTTSVYAEVFPCKTTFEKLNIPYVTTTSVDEFYYCFGLNHGRDRAWQMDFFRRVGEGKNAEVLGYGHLKSDLMMRLLDLPELAEKLWSKFPPEKKKIIELYAKGVNEGFKTGKTSFEFKDLGYSPEAWKPQDTLLVLLLQSFDQTRKTFTTDYNEEKRKMKWGDKAPELFNDENMPWENTILKNGEYKKNVKSVKSNSHSKKNLQLWAHFPRVFGLESGSNNWVVSKKKSQTGNAILANDPHLNLKTPMFWYWINLKSPEMNVMGGSIPGVPVIASGTNGKVSWGLTNSYLNSADLYFLNDVKEERIKSIRPTVMVKFWFFKLPFFFKSFDVLDTGHKILPLETESSKPLALRWTGFNLTPEDIYPMFDLAKVKDIQEMDDLLLKIGLPSWNYVFADSKGKIGYRMIGKTYRQKEANPYGIAEISVKDFLSEEILAPKERPHVLNPEREYVYTANNRHWPLDAKFYGGRGYSYSFRGYRIDELLKGEQSVESFMKIQCDEKAVDAVFFLPLIQKYLNVPEFRNSTFKAYQTSKDIPLYRRFIDILLEKWEINEYALYRLLNSDEITPNKIDEMKLILSDAREQVEERTWGEIHKVKFSHMSKNENWIFSPELPGVGDTHSVNPGTSEWNSDLNIYEQYSGASMRMIIEMDDVPHIWLALPGVNREYATKHSDAPWKSWQQCQYTKLKF